MTAYIWDVDETVARMMARQLKCKVTGTPRNENNNRVVEITFAGEPDDLENMFLTLQQNGMLYGG